MYRLLMSLMNLLCIGCIHGQSLFDILPDVGGIGGQAMCFIAVPDTNSLRVIGHRYDTVLPGPNTKPWLGEFNYDGDLITVLPLIDSQYTTPFNVFNIPLANKKDDIYYYYTRRDDGGQYFTSNLIELNVSSGEISKSKLIKNENYPDLAYPGIFVGYNKINNTIILLNSLYKDDSVLTIIVLLDTLFNINKVIDVKELTRATFAHWCKLNSDGSITILGFASVGEGEDEYYDIFINKIDSSGNSLEYRLAPTEVPLNLGLAHTRTILEDDHGNWVVSGLYYDDRSDSCFNCYQYIPYVFSATQDFDSLLWLTRFYDVSNQNNPQYFLHSMTQLADGFVVAADHLSIDNSLFPISGVLFKTSLYGDSLWMKHYIPLNWNEDRVAWINFNDIKSTPDGNIIVVGSIGDLDLQIVRPWILHLDSDGCLVPGCNTVSNDDTGIVATDKKFSIYPNPVHQELYLLSTITSTEMINIKIVTNEGRVVRSTVILPQTGNQYILPLHEISSGVYHLVLSSQKKEVLESHTFIKQ